LIDEGIVEEMESRQAQFDRGHAMLNQLENASLLQGSKDDENYRYVKMHGLIWDMAVKIMKESSRAMVQAGAQLTELPDVRWWREDLSRVSLIENRIKDISTLLLLCRNYELKLVESPFFQQFKRLEVLDLSGADTERLPDSISHLVSLTVLLLVWCAKLTALEKLDLSCTGLEDLPEGMERLKDLRYLNLDGNGVRVLRLGILPIFSKLQFLKLHQGFRVVLSVRVDETLCLRKLETLECNFCYLIDFGIFRF
jgi:disease resistance protein RPS2